MGKTFRLLAACALLAGSATASARDLDAIRKSGVMRIGVTTLIPWVMKSPDGELMGSEIDIAHRLSSDLDVNVELIELPFAALFDAIAKERIDVIVAGMSITPQRALRVNFTRPYAHSQYGLVGREDRVVGRRTPAAFNDEKLKIGAASGTIAATVAVTLFPSAQLMQYPRPPDLVADLASGELDAFVAVQPVPFLLASRHPDRFVEPLEEPVYRTAEAFAVKQGNYGLLHFLNAWIAARNADGFLARTRAYWFEGTDWLLRFAPALLQEDAIDEEDTDDELTREDSEAKQ